MNAERIAVAAAGVVAVSAAAWLLTRKPAEVGASVGRAAAEAAGGVVLGIGDAVGLPRTNETECERALREGRKWDASFACPAATFLKHVFD